VAGFFIHGAPDKFITPGGPMSPEGLFGPLLHMIEI
ncbi:MAG: hypothetical protein RL173_3058, partial [Fibrobacterota bacterium]